MHPSLHRCVCCRHESTSASFWLMISMAPFATAQLTYELNHCTALTMPNSLPTSVPMPVSVSMLLPVPVSHVVRCATETTGWSLCEPAFVTADLLWPRREEIQEQDRGMYVLQMLAWTPSQTHALTPALIPWTHCVCFHWFIGFVLTDLCTVTCIGSLPHCTQANAVPL